MQHLRTHPLLLFRVSPAEYPSCAGQGVSHDSSAEVHGQWLVRMGPAPDTRKDDWIFCCHRKELRHLPIWCETLPMPYVLCSAA